MAKAPVLKTGGRKPLQVRILCPPLWFSTLQHSVNGHQVNRLSPQRERRGRAHRTEGIKEAS